MSCLKLFLFLSLSSVSLNSFSGQLARDAAAGGGIGGAAGGLVGSELGGRNGAIIGSAAGAAIGSAITTQDYNDGYRNYHSAPEIYYEPEYKKYKKNKKCPPGLAMQGRC